MTARAGGNTDIVPALLREAADWLMRLHAGDAGPAEWSALERWRASSAAHGQAWLRAENLLGELRRLPGGPVRATLEQPGAGRRRLIRLLWLPALPIGWLVWRQVTDAGERWQTATGEQRRLVLADGTQLLLNTDTDIAVQFNAQHRLIRLLSGEILVTSGPYSLGSQRPLIVATAEGSVRPIGTRFSVRRTDDKAGSQVAVFEGRVEVNAAGLRQQVARGQGLVFHASGPGLPAAIDDALGEAWVNGMIIARRMRLADLIAELDRYRPGLLDCHPDVANMPVSGTFPVLDPERSLLLLATSLSLKLRYRTRYWVTVVPG